MKIKCISGPVFVDGAMMFTGQVRDVAESIARKMVAEHPHSLEIVGEIVEAPAVVESVTPAEQAIAREPGETDVHQSVELGQSVAERRSGKGRRT